MEKRAFLAIILYVGLVCLRSYDMYWSTIKLINLAAFRSIMSRSRFSNLLTFIHAADDNDPAAVTDPAPELGAVSPPPPPFC